MHEVHAPDMVAVLRAQPDDGAVFVVEAFALLMALRELQAFFPPEPLDLLVIDHPAFKPEQRIQLQINHNRLQLGARLLQSFLLGQLGLAHTTVRGQSIIDRLRLRLTLAPIIVGRIRHARLSTRTHNIKTLCQ